MVKKKESTDRLLMIMLNLLLGALVSIAGWGTSAIISHQKETNLNQKETTQAVNELKIVLSVHNARIGNAENILESHDTRLTNVESGLDKIDDRVIKLEAKQ